ncbi:transporter [Bradyrhizobium sp. 24]|uniref:SphA family protein n=1 Tax=unclassified Bradyrhizobium TaxID=2631580 RepID=UPI001FF8EE44|nr:MULTISPECIES: transporter [unclassified Bradyrhizobium]MCK1297388.1 transporter [Bradyrhizobium sp. 37]MCK1377640.1 transporter [Bradyrhizobium sp. 24]MCK1769116.1 transporter [Bradyrhizobium sp. 134]
MSPNKTLMITACIATSAACTPATAYEFGSPGWLQKPGIVIGAAAAAPPPGLYGFEQAFTYQSKIVGPGAPNINGAQTGLNGNVAAAGFLWAPGWSFLGASYDFVAVVPFVSGSIGSPVNVAPSGMHNTFFANELSWRLGDSGFFVKAGLGMYAPTGTQQGPTGLANVGNPWWTFQPNIVFSYLKDGWNLTANIFDEINTANTLTNYRSGDILHAEFTATKTIGKWTIGPVAYYVGQVTDDRSSAFYGGAINVNRYNIWAAGGMVGYNFGPVSVNVWGTQELSSNASGGTAGPPGFDTASITKGFSIFAQLNYRIWAPDAPVATGIPLIRK